MLKSALIIITVGIMMNCCNPNNKKEIKYNVTDIGDIYITNTKYKTVDQTALTKVVKEIIGYIDNNKLDPVRVEIFKDHEIVKDALKNESVKIERVPVGKYSNIIIPTKYKGDRIILYKTINKNEIYELYKLPHGTAKIDFASYLK